MTQANAQPRQRPTLQQFKAWAQDVTPAAKAVLLARLYAEKKLAEVGAYIRPIFDRYAFTYGAITRNCKDVKEGQPLRGPRDLYLVDDSPKLAEYYEDCDKAHRAHGFAGPHGHCPALRAATLVRETENALIDLAEPLFGLKAENLYDERAKYLELLIGAALKEG